MPTLQLNKSMKKESLDTESLLSITYHFLWAETPRNNCNTFNIPTAYTVSTRHKQSKNKYKSLTIFTDKAAMQTQRLPSYWVMWE